MAAKKKPAPPSPSLALSVPSRPAALDAIVQDAADSPERKGKQDRSDYEGYTYADFPGRTFGWIVRQRKDRIVVSRYGSDVLVSERGETKLLPLSAMKPKPMSDIHEEAKEQLARYVARPGTSTA